MNNKVMASSVACATLALCLVANAQDKKTAPNDADLIKSAMSAAPASVGKNATIVAMEADGKMRTLRKGSNGFTCMPDNPATPGPDPMCMDKNAMDWVHAWVSHKPPTVGKVGFMYMLQGDSGASNTKPYDTKETPDNNWIKTGSHVMIVGSGAKMLQGYPRSAKPDPTQPYVMWPGTLYEHLMLPVR